MSSEDMATLAEKAITAHERAGELFAQYTAREMELEADRGAVKQVAIARLMEQENPNTKKQHSASSASDFVALDQEYRAHLLLQRDAVLRKNQAHTAKESARLRAQLAIALLSAAAPVA